MSTSDGLFYVRRPWICMHGVNVDEADGCRQCAALLKETLAEARHRYARQRADREVAEARALAATLREQT